MFEKLFKFFIPTIYRGHPEEYRQAKISILFYLINALGLTLNSYNGVQVNFPPFIYLNLIFASISIGLAFLIRAEVSFKICATILTTIGFFYVNFVIYNTGGIDSVTIFGLLFFPLYFLFLSNNIKQTIGWMTISTLNLTVYFLYDLYMGYLPINVDVAKIDAFNFTVLLAQFSTIFILVAIFQKQKDNAVDELLEINNNLKRTQAQLIQSEKMASLGELTAGIAHEIQNPLNFVNNFSDVSSEMIDELIDEMDKGDLDEVKAISESLKMNLLKINHHGNRASSIVKGMLEHSRTANDQKEPTDINLLADEFFRLAYHGLRAKNKGSKIEQFNAAILTDFDPKLPKINVVSQDIGRVLLNLINNAFQAIEERSTKKLEDYKPTLTISTKTDNGNVLITIKDNGAGIPNEIKEKIFQPFFTTKPTGKGTGLGLSLAYDIIKKHGGNINVESEIDVGTTFTIILPVS